MSYENPELEKLKPIIKEKSEDLTKKLGELERLVKENSDDSSLQIEGLTILKTKVDNMRPGLQSIVSDINKMHTKAQDATREISEQLNKLKKSLSDEQAKLNEFNSTLKANLLPELDEKIVNLLDIDGKSELYERWWKADNILKERKESNQNLLGQGINFLYKNIADPNQQLFDQVKADLRNRYNEHLETHKGRTDVLDTANTTAQDNLRQINEIKKESEHALELVDDTSKVIQQYIPVKNPLGESPGININNIEKLSPEKKVEAPINKKDDDMDIMPSKNNAPSTSSTLSKTNKSSILDKLNKLLSGIKSFIKTVDKYVDKGLDKLSEAKDKIAHRPR